MIFLRALYQEKERQGYVIQIIFARLQHALYGDGRVLAVADRHLTKKNILMKLSNLWNVIFGWNVICWEAGPIFFVLEGRMWTRACWGLSAPWCIVLCWFLCISWI